MHTQEYFIYIVTNVTRRTLYTGMTCDLIRRLGEHKTNALGPKDSFAGKYNCFLLVHWEHFQYVNDAIAREKEVKNWSRAKKEALINTFNPDWKFLNDEVGCPSM